MNNQKTCFVKRIVIIILCFINIQNYSYAEDTSKINPSYIIFANYNINYHKTNFSQLPGIDNCCPQFNNGQGGGYSFGFEYEYSLPYQLSTGLGVGLYSFKGTISALETKPIRINNSKADALIEHVIEASISDIGFTPYLGYNITDKLHLSIGGHIGFLLNKTFRQYEQIKEPADQGVFVDTGTRIRNQVEGTIPESNSVYAGIFFNVSYDFRLSHNSSWLIAPSLTYTVGRSDVVSKKEWTIDALMLGIKIKHSPKIVPAEPIHEYRTIYKIDTIIVLNNEVIRNTVFTGKQIENTRIIEHNNRIINETYIFRRDTLMKRPLPSINVDFNVPVIHLEGQYVTQAFPLLPVVFFDLNSAEINDIYKQKDLNSQFDIEQIAINPLVYQINLLNIIGSRLIENQSAKLILAGYCDSITEGNNRQLANRRAEAVRNFMTNNWNIASDRIILKPTVSLYPPEATATRNDSGYSENRRVEISSDNPAITAPIIKYRFLEPQKINPPELIINTDGSTQYGIESWQITISKGAKVLSTRKGKGFPGLIVDSLQLYDFNSLFSNEPIALTLEMTDTENQTSELTKEIQVAADTSEYELQRLSLILFEVGSDKLNDKSINDIKVFLNDIGEKSIIRIKGYTDPLGTPSLNRELSYARAKNTAEFIKKHFKNLTIESVEGVADSQFPPGIKSYESPIERFLSRTVFIEVLNKRK